MNISLLSKNFKSRIVQDISPDQAIHHASSKLNEFYTFNSVDQKTILKIILSFLFCLYFEVISNYNFISQKNIEAIK